MPQWKGVQKTIITLNKESYGEGKSAKHRELRKLKKKKKKVFLKNKNTKQKNSQGYDGRNPQALPQPHLPLGVLTAPSARTETHSKWTSIGLRQVFFTLPPVKTVSKTNQQRIKNSLQSAISVFHVHLQKHDALHGLKDRKKQKGKEGKKTLSEGWANPL